MIAGASEAWGGIAGFIGAAIFPVGLILVLLAGGELLTGNMMAVSLARFKKRISTKEMIRNLALVTVSNMAGALFVAYFFGHVTGLTGSGVYLEAGGYGGTQAGRQLPASFLVGPRLQLARSARRVAVLRIGPDEWQNSRDLVSDDGVCSHRLSARGGKHVPHSGRDI